RGYDATAVRGFLIEASEHFEQALRETERLKQEIARLEGQIRQHKDVEATLTNTLLHAQKVSEDMKATAQLEAERLVREARGRAELLMAGAQNRLEDAQREIDGLKLRRREAESNVESIISSLHSTLEFIREQQREPPRLVPHRPRIDVAS
ncbi:MAG TPA: DivIVA domain-containing protein, partial [Vicinamibacterales bacterium]